jgi:ribulose-phosphate 3-epimerase
MTVQPGFGGQSFREDTLPKMELLDRWRSELNLGYRLQVDGGIDATTAPLCRSRGIDTLVAGTAFYNASDQTAFATTLASL